MGNLGLETLDLHRLFYSVSLSPPLFFSSLVSTRLGVGDWELTLHTYQQASVQSMLDLIEVTAETLQSQPLSISRFLAFSADSNRQRLR